MISKLLLLAQKMDSRQQYHIADRLESFAELAHKLDWDQIQKLENMVKALLRTIKETLSDKIREWATLKLEEYRPLIRKYAPHLDERQTKMEF